MKKFIVATAVAGSLLAFNALAEEGSGVTAEIGVVSNALGDGYTESNDSPSVNAAVEYSHDIGFHIGAGVMTIVDRDEDEKKKNGIKYDFSAGYGHDLTEQLSVDLSLAYANNTLKGSKAEIDGSVEVAYQFMEKASATLGYTKGLSSDDDRNKYSYIGLDFDFDSVAEMVDVNLHVGFANDGALEEKKTSTDFSGTVSKGDFEWAEGLELGATVSKASQEKWGFDGKKGDEVKALVFAKMSFDL